MLNAMSRKNDQLDELKLSALNTAAKLVSRARQMEGWKRVVLAISESSMPRIEAALAVVLNAGYGFRGVLDMLDRAARHVYRPQSYAEADFHRAYLIWKLGGAAAAQVAHRALGLPSIDATRRHVATRPTRASPGFPSLDELLYNLLNTFDGITVPATTTVLGYSMAVDEIKVQERLRWEASTNKIHGLCREHSAHCVLDFNTIEQADFILSQLQEQKIHFVAEVHIYQMFA